MDEFIECVSLLREGLGKISCCEDLFELSFLVNWELSDLLCAETAYLWYYDKHNNEIWTAIKKDEIFKANITHGYR